MKVALSWLREFVPVEADPDEIAERLSLAGLHVDEVRRIGGGLAGVVVAEVKSVRDHPDADNLVVAEVDAGAEAREVVVGVRNFGPGDRVPLATPGAKLPGGREIGRRAVRGVVSEGMLCSPQELGVGDDHTGILLLDRDAPPGADIRVALELDDVVFDIDVLPNRPDALSVVGVARDVAAIYRLPLRVEEHAVPEQEQEAAELTSVEIEDPRGCGRYLARVITGVRVGPSPWRIRRRLWACGMRPISNVVDATNYVLLERGHPLHAFDMATLAGRRIVVRKPRKGETVTTIDGLERTLGRDDVAICDAERAVAVAGIMGGADTEVGERTTDVLLESAWFDPRRILRTARRLGLRTEASVRFERGADPAAVPVAAARCAALIAGIAGGRVARGAVDAEPRPPKPRKISVRVARVNALIGATIEASRMAEILAATGCTVSASKTTLRIEPPTFRPDMVAEEDVVEEVARLHGYDRVPSTLPRIEQAGGLSREQRLRRLARDTFRGAGLSEAQTLSMLPSALPERLDLSGEHPLLDPVRLANPLSEEEGILRPRLVPGLLLAAQRNVARGNASVALFEIGTVFEPGAEAVAETEMAAWVLTGPAPAGWHAPERPYDFFDSKGVLEAVLEALGVPDWSLEPGSPNPQNVHPGRAATVLVGGAPAGVVAELSPRAAAAFDLPGRVAIGSIELGPVIAAAREHHPAAVPRFPPVRRDLAVVVPAGTPSARVAEVVAGAGAPAVERAELFDVYGGDRIPEGTVSLAFALALRDPERTLTDEDAAATVERITAALRAQGWSLR